MSLTVEEQNSIITHMNTDHPEALRCLAQFFGGARQALHVEMVALTLNEAHISVSGHGPDCTLAIPLTRPVTTLADARAVLVEMTKEARAGLQESPSK